MPFPVYDEAFRQFLAFDLNHSVGAQEAVMRNQALPMHGERGHFPAIGFQPVAVLGRIHDCGTPIGMVEHPGIVGGPRIVRLPSGRSATPADINRNSRPTSIGMGGRHQSECPADIIGIRTVAELFDIPRGGCWSLSRHKPS